MSFASEVKKELLNTEDLTLESKKAMLYGVLIGSSEIVLSSNGLKIIVKASLLNVLKFVLPLLRELYGVNIGMGYFDEVGLQNRRFYQLEIIDKAEDIINDFHLMPFTYLSKHDKLIEKILRGKNIKSSTMERRNQYVTYIKRSEDISSTLAFMGASSGVFYFEDSRILRDVSNMANRMTNCDIANEIKCAKSCDEQLDAIKYLREHNFFEKMPVRLQSIALLREMYPDSSYEELSMYSDNVFGKNLSKSGITHCIRSLMTYYKSVKSDS